jgi:hypothetical protein
VLLSIPSGAGVASGKAVGPPEIAWKDMTFQQKKPYTKKAVTPTMKPIFQAFDGKKFIDDAGTWGTTPFQIHVVRDRARS